MPSLAILHPSDLVGEGHGVFVQHVSTLAELLAGRGWDASSHEPRDPRFAQAALDADLTVIQMLAAPEVEGIIRLRAASGRPSVFEITDNFLALEWTPRSHLLRSPLIRQHHLFHASLCDALQVYAPALAELFAGVSRRVIRFDPYVPIPSVLPAKPEGFVVGWGGTRSHEADLAPLAPHVVAFCRRHPDARFAYMGNPDVLRQYFSALPGGQVTATPFGTHEEYLAFVSGLHVGLGPMALSPFNEGRTDTRFATYAAYGAAAVLQESAPYSPHAEHARLFQSPAQVEDILEELYLDRPRLTSLVQLAGTWVCTERGRERLALQREEAYSTLLPRRDRGDERQRRPLLSDAQAAALSSALAQAQRSDPERALGISRELVAEHPPYAQAHWVMARSLDALGRQDEALRHIGALEVNPAYADQFAELAARITRRSGGAGAERHVARIQSPWRRLRLATGEPPAEQAKAILRHQPYDHFALAVLIKRTMATSPEAPELDALFARASLVFPEAIAPEHRPAHLARFLPV